MERDLSGASLVAILKRVDMSNQTPAPAPGANPPGSPPPAPPAPAPPAPPQMLGGSGPYFMAARMTDFHVCPMVNALVPHVGGIITGPCAPTTLIGGLPAARVLDFALCVGPIDVIATGSSTVLFGGAMAARMTDITAHAGVIVMGSPSVLIGGATGDQTQRAMARSLIDTRGTADQTDARLVEDELVKMPPGALRNMLNGGTRVAVCRGSVTEYRTDLAGQQPQNWPAGSNWNTVPGAFTPDRNEVVIATRGHGTPAGAHVPQRGDGHGSHNLVIHESMHAVDHNGGGSNSAAFRQAQAADFNRLPRYERHANGGREEAYAESAARYYGGGNSRRTPNLHRYWQRDPLNPNRPPPGNPPGNPPAQGGQRPPPAPGPGHGHGGGHEGEGDHAPPPPGSS